MSASDGFAHFVGQLVFSIPRERAFGMMGSKTSTTSFAHEICCHLLFASSLEDRTKD